MYDINRLAKVWHMPNEFAEAFVFLLENEFPKDYLEKEYNGNLEDIYFEDEIPDRLYILPHFAADLILYKDIEDPPSLSPPRRCRTGSPAPAAHASCRSG